MGFKSTQTFALLCGRKTSCFPLKTLQNPDNSAFNFQRSIDRITHSPKNEKNTHHNTGTKMLRFLLITLLNIAPYNLNAYNHTTNLIQQNIDESSDVLIHSQLSEAEAIEIIEFLHTQGINAKKAETRSQQLQEASATPWDIYVAPIDAVEAITFINDAELPKRKKSLLFEEYIRRQREKFAGDGTHTQATAEATEEIQKIPGVIDAEVLVNRPGNGQVYATIYVRHDGILDDPNGDTAEHIKNIALNTIPELVIKNLNFITERDRPNSYELPEYAPK